MGDELRCIEENNWLIGLRSGFLLDLYIEEQGQKIFNKYLCFFCAYNLPLPPCFVATSAPFESLGLELESSLFLEDVSIIKASYNWNITLS